MLWAESGLQVKTKDIAKERLKQDKTVKKKPRKEKSKKLNLSQLSLAFYLLIFGLVVSLVVFIMEVGWARITVNNGT